MTPSPSDPRAHSDQAFATIEALASVIPPSMVLDVLAAHGKTTQRIRKLPSVLVAWLVILLGLFREHSIANILFMLAKSLGVSVPWNCLGSKVLAPTSGAIAKARARLGWQPIRDLFRKLAALFDHEHHNASLWKGRKLYAIDGSTLLAPDMVPNDCWFSRPGSSRGKSAYPQIRCVLIVAALTHLIHAAAFGAYTFGELPLATTLLRYLPAGSVVLLDRGFYAFKFLEALSKNSCFFRVRAKAGKTTIQFKKTHKIGPGDWLGVLIRPKYLKTGWEEIQVRIVTYQLRGFRPVTLVTTLKDAELYRREEIVGLYHERWEIELCYDEIKTHTVKNQVTFRSKTPQLVIQEAYGLLVAYNAVRALMVKGAEKAGTEPKRLSYTDCLLRIKAAVWEMGRAETKRLPGLLKILIEEIGSCKLPKRRRQRRNPREVKIKMSKYKCKQSRVTPASAAA